MEHGKHCMCSSCIVATARGFEPMRCSFNVYGDSPGQVIMSRCELPAGHKGEHHNTAAERLADDARKPRIFSCGCSRFKVALGRCDVFDENGAERRRHDEAHTRATVKP